MEDVSILEKIEATELQKIKITMKHLYSAWEEVGIEKEQKVRRVTTAWSHIQKLVKDIYDDESAVCIQLKKRIKTCTDEITALSKVLSVETPDLVCTNLFKREEYLNQKLNDLKELKDKRLKDFKDLRNLEKHYSLLLGIEAHNFSSKTEIPSSADLKELQQHVNMLTEEHNKRYEKYCSARQELNKILTITEISPETSFEKHLCSEKEPLSLTDNTFRIIGDIITKTKNKKIELENKKKCLMDKLVGLWDRLDIESEIKTKFLSNHLNYKTSTLKSIEEEIVKYEEMKRQNIESFINSIRQELDDLWKKCGASDLDKQLFNLYNSTETTEDILIKHEQEVERWKKYYEKVEPILEKIEERNKSWELLLALDSKANDPARFRNRGGNLLKEEKERNKLQKTLPTLEEEIFKRIEFYKTETGRTFLYLGEDYKSYIINGRNAWVTRTTQSRINFLKFPRQQNGNYSPLPNLLLVSGTKYIALQLFKLHLKQQQNSFILDQRQLKRKIKIF